MKKWKKENQKKILDILKAMKNIIIIFISHDQNVLNYISDNILLLDEKTKKIEVVKRLK